MRPPLKILLTGASSGIGLATAHALTAAGHEVWGTSRDLTRLPSLPRFHSLQIDLQNVESIRNAVQLAQLESGGIDVLINNAGDVVNAPLETLAADGLQQQFQVLFFGPIEIIRQLLPSMRGSNQGLIINVTSLAARFPIPFNAAYSAAKSALGSATECLRLELTGTQIRLIDVQPGDVATEILHRSRLVDSAVNASYEPNLSRARAAELGKMKQAASPEKVARLILSLLHDPSPPPRVLVGNWFESRIAPLADRLLPRRLIEWSQRLLYDLKS